MELSLDDSINYGGSDWMKKIAIISAGVLPVPPVKGGAVENLVDFILSENELENKLEITVFSINDDAAADIAIRYKNCSFEYINVNKTLAKIYKSTSKTIERIFGRKIIFSNLYIRKVCGIIKKNNFDNIVIENRSEYVLPVAKSTISKVSLHIHNDYLNSDMKSGKEIFDSCHRVITVSEFIKNRVLTLDNKYNEKIRVLQNCTDIKRFNKNLYYDFRKYFREKNNIQENEVVIMFSGRIHPTKGIKELITAFNKIGTRNCKLLVVGSSWYGSNDKSRFAQEIEKMSCDIKDQIIFTGFVPFDQMPKFHAVSDIAVIPSIWDDPAPLVVFEAMASGLPLITTDSGGIPECINEDVAIMLKRDERLIENLTYSMEELINDEEKRNALGEAARKHALQYNKERYYRDFIEILGENIKK